jgi:hypothetical protein
LEIIFVSVSLRDNLIHFIEKLLRIGNLAGDYQNLTAYSAIQTHVLESLVLLPKLIEFFRPIG